MKDWCDMPVRVVTECEFRETLKNRLRGASGFDYVTGPGRSGAIASVYASHFLGVPFVPFKCVIPHARALVVDTAEASGRTLRKAARLYNADAIAIYQQPPRVKFWYEELSMVRGRGNEYRISA